MVLHSKKLDSGFTLGSLHVRPTVRVKCIIRELLCSTYMYIVHNGRSCRLPWPTCLITSCKFREQNIVPQDLWLDRVPWKCQICKQGRLHKLHSVVDVYLQTSREILLHHREDKGAWHIYDRELEMVAHRGLHAYKKYAYSYMYRLYCGLASTGLYI